MTAIQEARVVLADTEKALRDLMQRELKAQRYSELAEIAGWADGLARLARGEWHLQATSARPAQSSLFSSAPNGAAKSPVRKAVSKRTPTTKRDYPRFERDGDRLVKVGWSKKTREEYEHRAPRLAALAFVQHLASSVKSGRTFAIEDIVPVNDTAGEELPSYQVYLTLAWLRDAGAIEKKGRDGYVVTHRELDGSAFDTLWHQTPERS